MSIKRITIAIILLAILLGGFLYWDNRESRFLRNRINELELRLAKGNKADTFMIRDSIPVWKDKVIEVDKTDYKKQLADRELIKSLELRVSQVLAENRTLLRMHDAVNLLPSFGVKDSLLRYSDKWVSFSFDVRDSVLEYDVRDSVTTIISKEYKHKFLWFRWGTKGYQVFLISHNPKSRIEYNQFISVKE